jgi:hypothetical protein
MPAVSPSGITRSTGKPATHKVGGLCLVGVTVRADAAGAAKDEAEGKLIIAEVLAASGLSAEIRRITALKTNL